MTVDLVRHNWHWRLCQEWPRQLDPEDVSATNKLVLGCMWKCAHLKWRLASEDGYHEAAECPYIGRLIVRTAGNDLSGVGVMKRYIIMLTGTNSSVSHKRC